MGNPNDLAAVPQQAPMQQTGTIHDNTISSVSSPPAYHNEKTETPGVPRSDDPARIEAAPQMAMPAVHNNIPAANNQMIRPLNSLTKIPAYIECPYCHQRSETNVQEHNSSTTWLYTALCCICCGLLALLPPLLHWGADYDHYCKNCGNLVARVPHDGVGNVTVINPPQAVAPPKQ